MVGRLGRFVKGLLRRYRMWRLVRELRKELDVESIEEYDCVGVGVIEK